MNKGATKGMDSAEAYTRLAPNVEKGWVEQFVLEQRLLGVPGSRIGDSLAVVESHVAESGESAHAAFGDPQAYAKADAPEPTEPSADRIDRGWVLGIVLGLTGMLLSTFSAQAGFSGESTLHVTVGLLVVIAIVAGSGALLLCAPQRFLRVITKLPMRSWIGWMLLLAAMVSALFLLPHTVAEISVSGSLVVGVILLIVGVLVQLRAYLGGRVQEDPIIGPGEQPAKSKASLVAILIFPGATLAMVGISWLLQQIVGWF